MKYQIIKDLEEHLTKVFGGSTQPQIGVERTPTDFDGDITVNCFRQAPHFKVSPMDIAEKAGKFCEGHDDAIKVQTIKAFVNITLDSTRLFQEAVGDEKAILDDCRLAEEERRKIVVEFSAPNTNKPQHLGHVRNNSLGQVIGSLFEKIGHDVAPVNLINDRGIHICKSMLAYQRWGQGSTPESTGMKGDHFVGDFYVKYQEVFKKQVEELRESRPDLAEKEDEELSLETEIGQAAQQMLIDWESGDPDVLSLWKTMNQWVIEGFRQTYKRMGVEFDRVYLESETYGKGREIINERLSEGIFREREDGAVVIDLDEEKLGTKVVLRSDGTSVYVTQDIGTTVIKQEDYNPDYQVWVVGDEQIFHFKVLFTILKRLGYSWADNLQHLPYGMVNLPSGKMKSREGTVVDADDLFDELAQLARKATLDRYDTCPDDIDHRAEVIGMSAIKFMLLSVNAQTAMTFDPEASVKFEGDTGPYVLYACARISSMLKKAEKQNVRAEPHWSALGTEEEKELALLCAQYGETVRRAAAELNPSLVTGFLLQLAKSFSRFYRECPVLTAPSPEMCQARLALSKRVHTVLKDGLETLTIQPLESM